MNVNPCLLKDTKVIQKSGFFNTNNKMFIFIDSFIDCVSWNNFDHKSPIRTGRCSPIRFLTSFSFRVMSLDKVKSAKIQE
jgi:hypothetical protein